MGRGNCGFEWFALRLEPPPSTKVTSVKQVCVQPNGHKDDHRSLGNVTKENKGDG